MRYTTIIGGAVPKEWPPGCNLLILARVSKILFALELLCCLNTCKCDIRIVCFEMASLGGVLGGEVSYISHWARENKFFGEKFLS